MSQRGLGTICSNILARFNVPKFMPFSTRALSLKGNNFFLNLMTKQRTYLYKNQFGFIPKRAKIFKGIFENVLDVPKDAPTY